MVVQPLDTKIEPLACLRGSELFEGLDSAWLERLAQKTVLQDLTSGELVWHAGATAKHFFLVEAGLVAIRQLTLEGNSFIVTLFGPGDSLCIAPALQGIEYPGDAVVISETANLLLVPAAPVVAAMASDAVLNRALNRVIIEHSKILRHKIDIVSAGPVPRRLATLMLNLVERFGVSDNDDRAFVPIALTRESVGQLINARTETVIRTLSKWQKAGWFTTSPDGFHIDRLEILHRIIHGRPQRSGSQ
ncbi:MAG: Crp/Fnr family transcriptional regulator [Gammaproteobacteria bacterium]|nr:Crp/Fnr family transcriptional regulator [Gammaproteobacteria bacterium]